MRPNDLRAVDDVVPDASRRISEDLPAGWSVVLVRAKRGWAERENKINGRVDKRDAIAWVGLKADAGHCVLTQTWLFQRRDSSVWEPVTIGGVGMYIGDEGDLRDGGVTTDPRSLRIEQLPWRVKELERQPMVNKPVHAIRVDCSALEAAVAFKA